MATTDPAPFICASHEALRSTLFEVLHDNPLLPVLLYGPPGSGKTTLLAALPQSTCTYIDLQHVDDLAGLLQLVARATSLVQEPSPEPTDPGALLTRLVEHLERRQAEHIPLVLDHVDHCTEVVQRFVKALTTLDEEQRPVCAHPLLLVAHNLLDLPCTITSHILPAMKHTEAIALLDELSSQRFPQKELATIADAVMQHPHGLAMCAKRLAIFSPQQILERLKKYPITRDFPAIAHLLEWSWESLTTGERELLVAATMFETRAFTQEMLCEIAAGWAEDALEPALERLSGQGLLQRVHAPQGQEEGDTFCMGRTICDFLHDHIARDPALKHHARQAEEQLIHHTSQLAMDCFSQTRGNRWYLPMTSLSGAIEAHAHPTYQRALTQWRLEPLDRERGEAVAACALLAHLISWKEQDFRTLYHIHETLCDELVPSTCFKALPLELRTFVCLAMADYHYLHYRYQEALQSLLPIEQEELPDTLRANLQVRRLSFDPASVKPEHLQEVIELTRQVDDKLLLAEAMLMEAHACIQMRKIEEGLLKLANTASFCQEHGISRLLARTLVFHGFALHEAGSQQEGDAQLQRAYEMFLEQGDVIGAAHALRILARQNLDTFELDLASARIDTMLELADLHGIGWLHSFGYFLKAQHLLETRQRFEALAHYERAVYHYTRQQNTPLLTITRLYQSICYKLIDQLDTARQLFDEALQNIDAARSVPLRLHLSCEKAAWLALSGEHDEAKEQLVHTHSLIAHCDDEDLLVYIHQSYESYVELARFLSLGEKERRGHEGEALYSTILGRLSSLYKPRPQLMGRSAFHSCMETRTLWYQLEHMIPADLMAKLQLERQDPDARALIIDTSARAFRPPGSYAWVSLARKQNPYKLLEALLTRHLTTPGEALTAQELITQIWPEDVITPEAAQNRLHVTLSTLRGANLKEHIIHQDGGYMLAPALVVLEA